MKYLLTFFIFTVCVSLVSCSYTEPAGYDPYPIDPNPNPLVFSNEGGVDSVTTKREAYLAGFADNDLKAGSLNDTLIAPADVIEHWNWFTIQRIDSYNFKVFVKKNDTGQERNVIITLQCGNRFDIFEIKQER